MEFSFFLVTFFLLAKYSAQILFFFQRKTEANICNYVSYAAASNILSRSSSISGKEDKKYYIPNSMKTRLIYVTNNRNLEEFHLLGYGAMYPVESQPMFRRNILPLSSG
jgi:hypothetical protein